MERRRARGWEMEGWKERKQNNARSSRDCGVNYAVRMWNRQMLPVDKERNQQRRERAGTKGGRTLTVNLEKRKQRGERERREDLPNCVGALITSYSLAETSKQERQWRTTGTILNPTVFLSLPTLHRAPDAHDAENLRRLRA